MKTTSIELGEPIGIGMTAEIYNWPPDQILKLYFEQFGSDIATYEQQIHQAIYNAGLRVPAVGEIVEIEGKFGLSYKKIEGNSMSDKLKPWNIVAQGQKLAELHAEMHANPFQQKIPNLKDRLKFKINDAAHLPKDLREAALNTIKTLPDGNKLCHGDFHPANIMFCANEPIIIDWLDASVGSPMADVARTSILTLGYATQVSAPLINRLVIHALHKVYLRRYFQLRPGGEDEYQRWFPVIAAARLNENVPGWDNWLLKQAMELLQN